MALDATVGGANADSYIDVATFDALALTRSNVPEGSSTAEKETALKAATSRLEQERYRGDVNSTSQRLKWPRAGVFDDDGNEYSTGAIPRPLQEATADLAIALLTDPAYLDRSGLAQFEELSVGPIALTPRATALLPGDLPSSVKRWLRNLRATFSGQAQIVRG